MLLNRFMFEYSILTRKECVRSQSDSLSYSSSYPFGVLRASGILNNNKKLETGGKLGSRAPKLEASLLQSRQLARQRGRVVARREPGPRLEQVQSRRRHRYT